ncbi:hypothetical protein CAEBREN_12350 [Caenorhabditis brenneri]|uniref:Protein N-terminal glutamine amidohydrolase n=1 Tax=Caenorhabditis brenneri TaxID=135651 RepID=G0NKK1_CAEBE|nr:hypothetical protein CAEBREN_12350 [Caenorhabditis brenneri]
MVPSATEALYQSCYCEENVYKLFERIPEEHRQHFYAVFISNHDKMIPLWSQKAARAPGEFVMWDYHVIAIRRGVHEEGEASKVYDLDSVLEWGVDFRKYWEETMRMEEMRRYQPIYRRKFRIIPAEQYLTLFSSDRSHMLGPDGNYLQPPPLWPLINSSGIPSNLMKILDFEERFENTMVMDEDEFPALYAKHYIIVPPEEETIEAAAIQHPEEEEAAAILFPTVAKKYFDIPHPAKNRHVPKWIDCNAKFREVIETICSSKLAIVFPYPLPEDGMGHLQSAVSSVSEKTDLLLVAAPGKEAGDDLEELVLVMDDCKKEAGKLHVILPTETVEEMEGKSLWSTGKELRKERELHVCRCPTGCRFPVVDANGTELFTTTSLSQACRAQHLLMRNPEYTTSELRFLCQKPDPKGDKGPSEEMLLRYSLCPTMNLWSMDLNWRPDFESLYGKVYEQTADRKILTVLFPDSDCASITQRECLGVSSHFLFK